jgi:hypothetical protein
VKPRGRLRGRQSIHFPLGGRPARLGAGTETDRGRWRHGRDDLRTIPVAPGDTVVTPGPADDAPPWDDTTWAAWAVGLVEPLVDPFDRVTTLEAMRAQAQGHPLRAVTLLAGTLTDLLDSLPEHDPWRHVDPGTFGTYRDGLDLVPTEAMEIREDIGLAALARPLGRDGARLVHEAEHGWENAAHAAISMTDPVPALTRAVAWASWRRRAYVGEDSYPVLVLFSWLRRAALVAAGHEIDDEPAHEEMRETAKIVDDLA